MLGVVTLQLKPSMVVYFFNLIAIVVMIFRERRKPQSILVWSLAFYALPIVAFIFYIFIGRGPTLSKKKKYLGKVLADEKYYQILEESYSHLEGIAADLSNDTRDFIKFCTRYNNSPCLVFNDMEVFTDINMQYERMLCDIKNAKQYVNVLYFIYKDSKIGRRLRDLLVKKAKEGVIVRVLVDDFGTWRTGTKFFRPIQEAGGEVVRFLSSRLGYLNRNVNYRNHRKIVVVDGEVAYTGGANIGDEYANMGKLPWRDTHLRIIGDAVAALNLRFLQDYAYASNKKIDLSTFSIKEHQVNNLLPMQVVSCGPDWQEQNLKQSYIKLIYMAKKRIWLQTPYYIPDDAFQDAIKSAINSGVDVRIMIPGVPDKKLVYYATKSYVADLVKAGAKVYFHPKFLHAKTLLVDDEISSIGTFNLDIRSFQLHFELTNFIYGREFGLTSKNIFLADQSISKQWTKQDVKNRTKRERFLEYIMRLFSPLL